MAVEDLLGATAQRRYRLRTAALLALWPLGIGLGSAVGTGLGLPLVAAGYLVGAVVELYLATDGDPGGVLDHLRPWSRLGAVWLFVALSVLYGLLVPQALVPAVVAAGVAYVAGLLDGVARRVRFEPP